MCVGQTNRDHVFTINSALEPGETHRSTALTIATGGGAANQAATIARLGAHAVLVSRLGDDVASDCILAELRAEGVDVALVEQLEATSTATSAVIVDADGERTIVNRSDPALYDGPPGPLPVADAVSTDARWSAATSGALQHARALGVPAVVDVDERVPGDRMDAINRLATHIVFSAQGLRHHASADDLAGSLRRAQQRTSAFVAVTCGAQGVYWLADGELRHQAALEIEPRDTTGAGDAFHGAFALAIAGGASIEPAIADATIVAGLACARSGAWHGLPTGTELAEARAAVESTR